MTTSVHADSWSDDFDDGIIDRAKWTVWESHRGDRDLLSEGGDALRIAWNGSEPPRQVGIRSRVSFGGDFDIRLTYDSFALGRDLDSGLWDPASLSISVEDVESRKTSAWPWRQALAARAWTPVYPHPPQEALDYRDHLSASYYDGTTWTLSQAIPSAAEGGMLRIQRVGSTITAWHSGVQDPIDTFTGTFEGPVGVNIMGFMDSNVNSFSVNVDSVAVQAQEIFMPKYYALLVGMDYPGGELYDDHWSEHATLLEAELRHYSAWNDGTIEVLANPTWDDLKNRIEALGTMVSSGDEFLLFYSGHGGLYPVPSRPEEPGVDIQIRREDLLPITGAFDNRGHEGLELTGGIGMTDEDFEYFFSQEPWQEVSKTFLLDTCYSGGFWGSDPSLWSVQTNFEFPYHGPWDLNDLSNLNNIRLLASSAENQATKQPGIILDLARYLNDAGGGESIDYEEWFQYVAAHADPNETLSYAHLLDHDTLYSFAGTPTYFSNIPGDQLWANEFGPVAPIPEPSSLLLFGSSLLGLMGWRRRRKASNA
jgi:hypothetical protein